MGLQKVKQEFVHESPSQRPPSQKHRTVPSVTEEVIDLSDSDDELAGTPAKKQRLNGSDSVVLPAGFLEPLPDLPESPLLLPPPSSSPQMQVSALPGAKSFWKAGDYEGSPGGGWDNSTGGMDHVRVHPKFLHSNATSHKWALGAFAELLDNSLDEVCNGATYVNVDMILNKKDGSRMLLVEDNGGGMDPEKMRQCMSLGYSAKSKLANTIGQYGNGFKTSTMRLGADVIVFSRCCARDGKSATQSIGLLSYTFLRSTRKEDIVVPILDFENIEREWHKTARFSANDWNRNIDTIINWSPYSSEAELLQQFNLMKHHGTRIIIYNLWEDDQGQLELEFDSDRHDIQLRGVNRDEKNIQMANEYPNSRHFLTYRHSLRSYVSILYLRLPSNFRIILRGKDVEHHNVVNDMMMTEEVTYRPQPSTDGVPRDFNMVAVVTIGFVKDARAHIDVQGFNVYHKNRLIKPFWRVWNAAGSDGRGVIGVLEANFVEPAHDKQGFERTTVLARLENKLVQMQKTYWSSYCHKIGYAPRRNKKQIEFEERESSPDYTPGSSRVKKKVNTLTNGNSSTPASHKQRRLAVPKGAPVNEKYGNSYTQTQYVRNKDSSDPSSSSSDEDPSYGNHRNRISRGKVNGTSNATSETPRKSTPAVTTKTAGNGGPMAASYSAPKILGESGFVAGIFVQKASVPAQKDSHNNGMVPNSMSDGQILDQLKEENRQLKERLERKEEEMLDNLQRELQLEKDKCKSLETKLQEVQLRLEELNKEQESLIDIFSEERDRRDEEEEKLRKKLSDASNLIEALRERVRLLESKKSLNRK